MFKEYEKNPILVPDPKLKFEKECVYNPCAVVHNGKVNLIYRAEGEYGDYISRLCLASSKDGIHFTRYKKNPVIAPTKPKEKRGCEDPRITKIGDKFYLVYTEYKGQKKKGGYEIYLGLATSKDLKHWKKEGELFEDMKSGVIYPKKVDGEYLMFVGEGNIQIARSKDLKNWKLDKKPLLKPTKRKFENRIVEVGPPPVILKDKVVLFFNTSNKLTEYFVSYCVLDKNDLTKVLYRSKEPILKPEKMYELYGKVNRVIFAEGLVDFKGKYFLYFGGADKCIGVATASKKNFNESFGKKFVG